jgi:hypothetical protein
MVGPADERLIGRRKKSERASSSGGIKHMTNANSTTEYKQTTTREQYRFLCGIVLPRIQVIFGVNRKAAHKRMRDKLIEWGYIKRSRSELTYHQTIEITQRFKNYLAKQGIHIE